MPPFVELLVLGGNPIRLADCGIWSAEIASLRGVGMDEAEMGISPLVGFDPALLRSDRSRA